jgi:Nucleotidyl transferase AbiEii toxin, Type IV TA system
MLYYQTVSPHLLTVLKKLFSFQELSDFRLVGGTSLALQMGHRKSLDIDLFTDKAFDAKQLQQFIYGQFEKFTVNWENKNGFACMIDEIKVDFFNWVNPFLYPVEEVDSLRLSDKRDIAAMKLEAITSRKEKKDFIDIAFLLKEYSLKELLLAFRQRYPFISHKLSVESLLAVDYADDSVNPEMLITTDWNEIKQQLTQTVEKYFWEQQQIVENEKLQRIRNAEELIRKKKDKGNAD